MKLSAVYGRGLGCGGDGRGRWAGVRAWEMGFGMRGGLLKVTLDMLGTARIEDLRSWTPISKG